MYGCLGSYKSDRRKNRAAVREKETKQSSFVDNNYSGVGACLCCVENTDEGHLCVCKDGPVFNIKKLLWQI